MGFKLGKIFRVLAPVAAGLLIASGAGAPLGLALGASEGAASAVGGAVIGAGGGLLSGGGLKSTAIGGVTGGIGGYIQGAGGLANAAQGVGLGSTGVAPAGSILWNAPGQAINWAAPGVSIAGSGASGLAGFIGNAGNAIGGGSSSGGGIGSLLSGGNLLSAAGNLYSGIQGTQAAKDMAAAQQAGNANALALQSKIYDQTTANMKPFLGSGTSANQRLSDLLGISGNTTSQGYGSLTAPFTGADLQNTPGYQFQLEQGTKAMNQSLGAKGSLFSGDALKAAQTFGQGLADQTYNDAYTRYLNTNQQNYNMLNGQSANGQQAAANLGATGQNFANAQTTGLENQGNITANQILAGNTAVNQGLSGLISGNYGFAGGGGSSYQNGVTGQGNHLPIYDPSGKIVGYKTA